MLTRFRTYILLGLCVVMTACDRSCDYLFEDALDSFRTVVAGTSTGIYKMTTTSKLVAGSSGGSFTQMLEIPRYYNSNLRPALPAAYQPGFIGISQWGISRWDANGGNLKDFSLSSTPFNAILDVSQFVLYTSHPSEGEIQKFDLATNTVSKFIQLGGGAQPTLMVSPYDCGYFAFLDISSLRVSLFSPKTDSVTSTFSPSHNPSGLGLTPDGSQIWVLDNMASSISTWEPRTSTQISKISIPTPNSIIFTPDGMEAYITSNTTPFRLFAVNTETYQIDNTLTLDERPVNMARDLYGSAYWIQNASGTVTAIDPLNFSVIGKTPAAPGTPLSLFSSSLALQF